jgi:hypothetical protein
LIGLAVRTAPAGGEFTFDLGGRIAYQVQDRNERDLWTFQIRLDPDPDNADIISFTAAGKVSRFTLRGDAQEPRGYAQETREYSIPGGALAVHLGPAPNGGQAMQLGNPEIGQGPPSAS